MLDAESDYFSGDKNSTQSLEMSLDDGARSQDGDTTQESHVTKEVNSTSTKIKRKLTHDVRIYLINEI